MGEAFYTAHFELFLGNACLGNVSFVCIYENNINQFLPLPGVGVLMLLVLTIERYVSVCHPTHMRPALGPPR